MYGDEIYNKGKLSYFVIYMNLERCLSWCWTIDTLFEIIIL